MEEKEKSHDEVETDGRNETPEEHKHDDHKKKKKKDDPAIELQKALEAKEENLKLLQDKMLYFQAEFENFKRLKLKEKQDTLRYGNEILVKELIPVVDTLEMALDHASKTDDFKSILDGVKLTLGAFLKVLERAGVTRVDAVGKKFDPNLHEAIYQEEKDDVEPDTVLSEFQKGYLLNERLIRASKVILSKNPEIQ